MPEKETFYPTFNNPHLTIFCVDVILDTLYEAENNGLTKVADVVGLFTKIRHGLEKDCFQALKKKKRISKKG